ncbi:36.4 kDa proline-rich protein-like [Gigantopelta aegis]|uniref:36.4 kDa proline-rich protein-like n=1 Tax=Gigantopelta aegis TaxID=1735272 RepID=UPI001B88A2EA|nr:36.4 kDa proline-rich protein-like [Gigantopelta aegis]
MDIHLKYFVKIYHHNYLHHELTLVPRLYLIRVWVLHHLFQPEHLQPLSQEWNNSHIAFSTNKISKKERQKMESPPKKNPKSPPPAGGIDMNEILKRRQQMNSRALEDLDKSRQQQQEADTEDKHVAPWLNQLKKTNRTSAENNDEPKEEEVPEFIRKRRSMSLMTPSIPPPRVPLEDEPSYTQPTITSKIKLPPPVPEEECHLLLHLRHTHPHLSLHLNEQPHPQIVKRNDLLLLREHVPSIIVSQKPNVPPHVPNMKAPPFPPKMRPASISPPSPPRTKAPPPLPNQEVATSEESQPMPYPPRSVPPKAGELTLPQSSPPLVDRPPSIIPKRPAPLPPTLSPATHGEPTPTTQFLDIVMFAYES